MYSVKYSESKRLDLPGRDVRVFIGADKVKSERMTVGLTEVPAHTAMTVHTHADMEEIIFVIQGFGKAIVGDSTERLEPNTAVIFPIGIPHQVFNESDVPLKFVFMFNPINDFSQAK
jgi:mannose-6-phosphate isomerase-like protein (cupin superfamily)